MSKIALLPVNQLDEAEEPDFKPLTAEQAQALRARKPGVSPWRVLAVQAAVGVVVTLLVWVFTGRSATAWSAAYGAMVVIIPAAIFARGLTSRLSSMNAGAAMLGFFLWEAVKIGLVVAMLFAAPRVVENLSWPALLVGLVVTMKAVWFSLLKRSKPAEEN